MVDALSELFAACKRAATNGLVGDQREESLDLIEPGTVGLDEVHVPARSCCQPDFNLGMAVGGVVVADAVDVQFGGHGLVNLAQERQEFLVTVARFAGRQSGSRVVTQRPSRRFTA